MGFRSNVSSALAHVSGCIKAAARFSGFRRSLSDTSHGYGIVRLEDKHPVRHGELAERFEVRPGAAGEQPGWSDRLNDRERSKLGERPPYARVGETYWYAFSFFLPQDFADIWPTKVSLGQFHQKETRQPPVMFQLGMIRRGPWRDWRGYWLDMNLMHAEQLPLIPEAEVRGRWHDILVHAHWSTAADGFVVVYVNGEEKARVNGPNTDNNRDIFFKYGLYRSFVSRFHNATGIAPPAQVAYFDEVRRGRSRADVEISPDSLPVWYER